MKKPKNEKRTVTRPGRVPPFPDKKHTTHTPCPSVPRFFRTFPPHGFSVSFRSVPPPQLVPRFFKTFSKTFQKNFPLFLFRSSSCRIQKAENSSKMPEKLAQAPKMLLPGFHQTHTSANFRTFPQLFHFSTSGGFWSRPSVFRRKSCGKLFPSRPPSFSSCI